MYTIILFIKLIIKNKSSHLDINNHQGLIQVKHNLEFGPKMRLFPISLDLVLVHDV